jgi:hypothetical protein
MTLLLWPTTTLLTFPYALFCHLLKVVIMHRETSDPYTVADKALIETQVTWHSVYSIITYQTGWQVAVF